jgi:hypothetical protein
VQADVTHYYTDVSRQLLDSDPVFPKGFRLIRRLYDDSDWIGYSRLAGIERWYVQDARAPRSLEGALVDPHVTLNAKTNVARITRREVRRIHPLNDFL